MGAEIANYNYTPTTTTTTTTRVGLDYQHPDVVNDDFTDSHLVDYVRHALKSVSEGDRDNYSELISSLHYKKKRLNAEDVALLVTSLKAISGAVSYIDAEHHETLLTSIFNMSLWNYSPDVMDALVELITCLAASNGKYVDKCLDMLVGNFAPPRSFLNVLNMPFGMVRKKQVCDRVHAALECITNLVPLAPSRLLPIILQSMPRVFQRIQEPEVVMFVENVFKLESSELGELVGNTMLIMAVVDLLIEFDVEIGWDDILEENPTKGLFDMELEDEHFLDDIEDDDEFPKEFWGRKGVWKEEVSDKLDKLDSLMVLTFDHLGFCKDNGRLAEVFESLLQSFQRTVLNAHKSKFAQFVIFYACSLDPDDCGTRFAEFLFGIFVCSSSSLLDRMSAVAYLASYLTRARFLSTPFVTSMLGRLVQWCANYSHLRSGDVNPKGHRAFYAGSQAIMYVLCFHMKSILDIPHLKSQLSSWPLRQVLKSSLAPLQVCLPSIVEEFLQQAKSANLLDASGTPVFHDVLESELSIAFGGVERLDMFFPFDPCLLRKSDSYIRPDFLYWSMVRKAYEGDGEGNSDDEIDVYYPDTRADPEDDAVAQSFEEGGDYDCFNDALDKMSITPRDSLLKKKFDSMQMPSRIRPSTSPPSL